jgi:flagellar hook-associated protein 1
MSSMGRGMIWKAMEMGKLKVGKKFFTSSEVGKEINALNISVSQAILEDVGKIAAAGTKGGVEDNTNILAIIDLRENKEFFGTGYVQRNPR